MVRRKEKSKLGIKIFAVSIALMFVGSIVAGALLYASPNGGGGQTLSDIVGSQILDRSQINEDIESSLVSVGIVFIETGSDAFADSVELDILSEFSSKFPIKVDEQNVVEFFGVYLVRDDDYNNSINVRTLVADEEFESFNESSIKDFVCDGMNPRFSIEYDYCIVKDF